jgi:phosphatidylserine/phosphatidylglycerophosphate/cardiolipin synthase-like enzyme
MGSAKIDNAMLRLMTDGGVELERYHPVRWYTLGKLNNRTHRKLLVVDGTVGFTGGVGIAPEWTGHAQDPQHWRDTHFQVEGPVVAQVQSVFLDNWIKVSGKFRMERITSRLSRSIHGVLVHLRIFDRKTLTTRQTANRPQGANALCHGVSRYPPVPLERVDGRTTSRNPQMHQNPSKSFQPPSQAATSTETVPLSRCGALGRITISTSRPSKVAK